MLNPYCSEQPRRKNTDSILIWLYNIVTSMVKWVRCPCLSFVTIQSLKVHYVVLIHNWINWIHKLTLKGNTISHCFTLFITGGPFHLCSFKQCSWDLIFLWDQLVDSIMGRSCYNLIQFLGLNFVFKTTQCPFNLRNASVSTDTDNAWLNVWLLFFTASMIWTCGPWKHHFVLVLLAIQRKSFLYFLVTKI